LRKTGITYPLCNFASNCPGGEKICRK